MKDIEAIQIEKSNSSFSPVWGVGRERETRKCYEKREKTKTMSFSE